MAAPTRPTLRSIVIALLVASLGLPVTGSTVAAAAAPPRPTEERAAAAASQSATTSAGELFFSSPAYSVDETGGSVTVTVSRAPDSQGAVSARIALGDVTTSSADYGAVGAADGFDPNVNSLVHAIAVQPDGKILIGGEFTIVGGEPRLGLARLNPDGSLDSFVANVSRPLGIGVVHTIVVQPDGKILVGGYFTAIGGQPRAGLARLNPDGSLDTFDANLNTDGAYVPALALYPDGRVLIAGAFQTVGGYPRRNIARLNPDATPDLSFDATGVDGGVYAIALMPDGKVFVAGDITFPIEIDYAGFVTRLNADGTHDSAYPISADNAVHAIVPQPDGKVVVGGLFQKIFYGALPTLHSRIGRFRVDGLGDSEFSVPAPDGEVTDLALQPDGKVIAGGDFETLGGQPRAGLARFNPNGSLDSSFDANANSPVTGLALQPDGRILVGGYFTSIGGQPRNHLARLNEYFVTWADGDTSDKTITIPIHDDALEEGNESLTLSLLVPGADPTATLTILDDEVGCTAPFVTQDPIGQSVSYGAGVSFTAAATGSPEPTVQWQENGSGSFENIPGATSTTLAGTAGTAPFLDGVELRAVFANGCLDPVSSSEATLTVTCPPPTVTQSPAAQTVSHGEAVSFAAAAAGTPAPSVQWQYLNEFGEFASIPGATNTTLTGTAGTAPFIDRRTFRALFSNGCSAPTPTTAAQLFVTCPSATVTDEPGDQSVSYGASVTFSAAASGEPAPDLVQWQQNRSGVFVDIPGATSTTLVGTAGAMPFVDGVEFRAVFSYSSGCSGPVTTSAAKLEVATNYGSFSFSSPAYSVEETGGTATITVRRTGGSDAAVSASISHVDATTSHADYAMPTVVDAFDASTNSTAGVYAIATQPDGKILVGGDFASIDGVIRHRLARLNQDGSLDAFAPDLDETVHAIAVLPGGKILVGGEFLTVGGVPRRGIARFNADGSLDSFDPNLDASVYAIAVQPDGKVLVGGEFVDVGGVSQEGIARLNADGSLDASFDPDVPGTVLAIALQPDGKVLFGGYFDHVDGVGRANFARVDANGTLDAFTVQTYGIVRAIHVQADGKIVFGGSFAVFETRDQAYGRAFLARVDADGLISLSDNFAPRPDDRVDAIASQPDGRLLVGGQFTTIGGLQRTRVARLGPDGEIDPSFDVNVDGMAVHAVALQADGQALVGGGFTTIGGQPRRGLARLTNYVVTWAEGDTSDKTITIPIVDDELAEGVESLTLSLQPLVPGSVNSTATLTILDDDLPCAAPEVTANPTSQSASPGAQVSFTAAASGSPAPTVRWQENGSGSFEYIPGATSATLEGTAGTAPFLDGVQVRAVFASECGSATSDAATLTVLDPPAATTTALAASPTTAMHGQPVTLAAAVTSDAATPVGSVEFFDGAASLGSQPLSGGAASLTVSTLAPGTHAAITARYTPSGNFAESTSAPACVTVSTTRYTTTSLVAPASPTVYGQAVVLSVTVAAPAGGTPSGTVKFYDGAMSLGSKTLSGGTASLTVTTLGAGTHALTAVYQGKAQFAASTSPAVAQIITQASTTTTLTSSLNPAPKGQTVTFTAVVSAMAPGGGTPTGQVAFYDGATLLGTGTVMSGTATFKTKKLERGSHTITAVYQGSANHATSTSSVLTQQVN